ncbi:MAG: hypothetical protein ACKVQC_09710 [Elusimicrobiota bacterium]
MSKKFALLQSPKDGVKRIFMFVGLILTSYFSSIHALSITPNIQKFKMLPGEKVSGQVTILNTDPETIDVIPTTKNWFILNENKKIKVADWLNIDSIPFVLKPDESKTVKFTVNIPKTAKGELVGMLSFRTKSASRSSIEFVMSSAIYAAVSGTEKVDGDIAALGLKVSSNTFNCGLLIRNKGNVHLRPEGLIEIYNSEDELMVNFSFPKGQPTYPGKLREYSSAVRDIKLLPGKYKANINILDSEREFLIEKSERNFTLTESGKVELK